MSRIEEIKRLEAEYKDADTNARLKLLVEKYGIEEVIAASGLSLSSVTQYTTRTNTHPVAWKTLIKAETILSQI
jgi:hypothetical protein